MFTLLKCLLRSKLCLCNLQTHISLQIWHFSKFKSVRLWMSQWLSLSRETFALAYSRRGDGETPSKRRAREPFGRGEIRESGKPKLAALASHTKGISCTSNKGNVSIPFFLWYWDNTDFWIQWFLVQTLAWMGQITKGGNHLEGGRSKKETEVGYYGCVSCPLVLVCVLVHLHFNLVTSVLEGVASNLQLGLKT